jgi:exodeoxyribonuclease-3
MKRLLLLLLLNVLPRYTTYAQHGRLKIISYNVLKGMQHDPQLLARFDQWIRRESPDIIFYQEMNGFSQIEIEKFAAGYGHPYAIIAKEYGYPVAISSRFPIVNVRKVLDNMWHGYISANIAGLHVFAVHLSPFSREKRLNETEEILAAAALFPKSEPVVIAGDYNSYQAQDSTFYSKDALSAQINRESNHPEIRNLNGHNFDYTVTSKMQNAGYTDAVNLYKMGFTYTMPTKSHAAPFKTKIRIDYIWLNKAAAKKARSADVIYDEDTDCMSDHYPLRLHLMN